MELIEKILEENKSFPNKAFIAQYYCPVFFGYENLPDCKVDENTCIKCWKRDVEKVKSTGQGRLKFK